MKFKAGDKVICVDVKGVFGKYLKLNHKYIIEDTDITYGNTHIKVEGCDKYFNPRRFKLVPMYINMPEPIEDLFSKRKE